MPGSHEFEFAVAEVPFELDGDAGCVGVGIAVFRPAANGEELQIGAVVEQALDQDQIVAGLVVLVRRGGREGVEQIHRVEHQAAAPAYRLASHGNAPPAAAVFQREAVQAVQQAVAAAVIHFPGEIQEPPFVAGGRLVENRTGVVRGVERIADEPDRRVVDHRLQRSDVASPQQAQVEAVIDGGRIARRVALGIALGQPLGRREPLDAGIEFKAAASSTCTGALANGGTRSDCGNSEQCGGGEFVHGDAASFDAFDAGQGPPWTTLPSRRFTWRVV